MTTGCINEEVEFNLGSVANVVVEPKVMDFRTDNYMYGNNGDIIGWDEIRTYEIEIRNTRDTAIKVEIKRNFPTQFWQLTTEDEYDNYDSDTIKYTLEMKPVSKQKLIYTLRTYHGTREDSAPSRDR